MLADETCIDLIVLVLAVHALGQGEAGAKEEVDGAAEETLGERGEVFVWLLWAWGVVGGLGEGIADRGRGCGGVAEGGFECARAGVQLGVVGVVVVGIRERELGVAVGTGGGLVAGPEMGGGKAVSGGVALGLVDDGEDGAEDAEAAEGVGAEVGGGGEAGVGDEGEEAVCEVGGEGGEVCGVVLEGVAEVGGADDGGDVVGGGEEGVPLRPVRRVCGGDPLRAREALDARGGGLELELRVLRRREERQPDRLWQGLEHGGGGEATGETCAGDNRDIEPLYITPRITYTLSFSPLSSLTLSTLHTPHSPWTFHNSTAPSRHTCPRSSRRSRCRTLCVSTPASSKSASTPVPRTLPVKPSPPTRCVPCVVHATN